MESSLFILCPKIHGCLYISDLFLLENQLLVVSTLSVYSNISQRKILDHEPFAKQSNACFETAIFLGFLISYFRDQSAKICKRKELMRVVFVKFPCI